MTYSAESGSPREVPKEPIQLTDKQKAAFIKILEKCEAECAAGSFSQGEKLRSHQELQYQLNQLGRRIVDTDTGLDDLSWSQIGHFRAALYYARKLIAEKHPGLFVEFNYGDRDS